MLERTFMMLTGLVFGCALAAHAQAGSDPSARCKAVAGVQIPGFALEITRAEWHPAGKSPAQPGPAGMAPVELPAHCRIDGMLDRRTGREGAAYGIGFALALPDAWNGRFLQQGGGGLNGTVGMPLGAVAAGGRSALARGFAVASTDTGHRSGDGKGERP